MFFTYDLLSNISLFHNDEMKELKIRKTFTDHNTMVMKLVIPNSLYPKSNWEGGGAFHLSVRFLADNF